MSRKEPEVYLSLSLFTTDSISLLIHSHPTSSSSSSHVILTDGKGVMVPIMNEMKFVTEVIVIETAASAYV